MNAHAKLVKFERKKQELQQQAQALLSAGHKFALGKKTSNLFRNRPKAPHRLDVSHFNQVIEVDTQNALALVEGMTTYEELVRVTLAYGFMPPVVPELKSITIGGALTGVAIEASSFRYGLVHETILEFEALLGDGRIISCSPHNEHRDLFFAFPNTYGSLGYALKIKVKLVPVKKYVKLTHLHFTEANSYFAKLAELCAAHRKESFVAFIDGVAFNKTDLHITLGEFVDNAPYLSDYKFMNIYYRSIKSRNEDYLTVHDFIWRWDPDWFWCSKNFGMQNKLLRFMLGKWCLKSTCYWKMMNLARNNPLVKFIVARLSGRTETIIQDIEVPIENGDKFHEFFHDNIGIKPVWICPVQAYDESVKFNFYALKPGKLYVNFGFWDQVPSDQPEGHYNILIEKKVAELQGHKSLYSNVYYDQETFWRMYDKNLYTHLKHKYDVKAALKPWYQKVTERKK